MSPKAAYVENTKSDDFWRAMVLISTWGKHLRFFGRAKGSVLKESNATFAH